MRYTEAFTDLTGSDKTSLLPSHGGSLSQEGQVIENLITPAQKAVSKCIVTSGACLSVCPEEKL